MPLWLIKLAIALVFGPPLLLCVVLLAFGDVFLKYLDRKEKEHDRTQACH